MREIARAASGTRCRHGIDVAEHRWETGQTVRVTRRSKPGYPCRHFSLTNKQGPDRCDLPRLLRRLAKQIEAEGIEKDVFDVRISFEDSGQTWVGTVYF